jgi:hypothetical protein
VNNVTCNNCNTTYSGSFCSNCGQRAIANKRLKFKDIVNDFVDNAFNIHKGLFYTFWNLIIKPGMVGRTFISGQRKRFTNPVRYLIIAVAIQAFMDYWFLNPELTEQPDFISFTFLSESVNNSMAHWNHILATQYSLIHNLTMIFIFPAACLVLFKKLKYNFTELLTVNFYYFSTGLILTLFTIIAFYVITGNSIPVPAIILATMSYVIWSNMSFFNNVRFLNRLLKVLTAMLFFMLFRVFFVVYILSVLFPLDL